MSVPLDLFVSHGAHVTIHPFARILRPDLMRLGSEIIIDDFVFIGRHQEVTIGNYVHIASHASITGGGRVFIADFTNIGSGARVFSGTDDFSGGGLNGPMIPAEFRAVRRESVTIESHAVVATNAVVFPNVTVGEGAIVGAGCVVTRDLEPWTVYVGAPAHAIKKRPRERMLEMEHELYMRYGRPEGSTRRPPFPT